MATPAIDYDALAKQHAGVDYDALATQHGGQAVSQPGVGQGLWDSTIGGIGSTAKALWDAATDTSGAKAINLVRGMVKAQTDQFAKAGQAYNDPNRTTAQQLAGAAGYGLAGALPVIGPLGAKLGEDAHSNPHYAAGEALGTALMLAGPEALKALPAGASIPLTPKMAIRLDPSEAAAVDWMHQSGVPVDAATATGNPVVRNVQGVLQNALGTSGKAKDLLTSQKAALQGAGDQLASQVAAAATPETAGVGVRSSLEGSAQSLGTQASGAYTRLENIEKATAPTAVQTGTKTSTILDAQGNPVQAPVTQSITAPIDLSAAKTALRPIQQELMQVLTPAQQQFSKGLTAINGLLNAPDAISASVADQTLSGLKSVLRDDSITPKAKYLVNQVVGQISPQVDTAVAKMGPAATQALQDGRTLTAAKYAVKGTLDQLSDEPVKLVNQLTQSRDASIGLLTDVAQKAPQAIPAIGRSVLDGLIEKAYGEVEQAKPGSALTDWQKIGASTKQILFKDPKLISDLDNFFAASKMVAKNPNPSGSGFITTLLADGSLAVASPHLGIPYIIGRTALGRILLSPNGAKILTDGFRAPLSGPAAAFKASRILSLAGTDAKPSIGGVSANPLQAKTEQ